MGCCSSRLEREETVARCRARLRYMKHLVKARHALAASHSLYLHSLRTTGTAFLQFAAAEAHLHRPPPAPPVPAPLPRPPAPPVPRRPAPMSPSSDTWTSVTASPLPPPPPPPPPPPAAASSWDFWDPFLPPSSRSVTEEEWEEATTTVSDVAVEAAAAAAQPPSVVTGFSKGSSGGELAVVVSRSKKDLGEIAKELDEYFLRAAEAGGCVSLMLDSRACGAPLGATGKVCSYGRGLSPLLWPWGSNSSSSGFTRFHSEVRGGERALHSALGTSHCSTLDKLCAWEKKLYAEVKSAEKIKEEREKRVGLLRRMEARGVDFMRIEKSKKEIEKLESKLLVAMQAIDSTSSEITRLRESELFPQLLELVDGLKNMWRSMYECHQVQTHIVQQLEYLDSANTSANPTSEIHRQSTVQLELEVQQWHSTFCSLVKSQRDYIHSLTGWLRLSLFQFHHSYPLTKAQESSSLYSFCDEWQLALDRIPDKVASEGIKSFLTMIHAVVLQQVEEFKMKKKSEFAFKELERRTAELQSLECRHGHDPTSDRSPVLDKRAKVETLKTKAGEEKTKYDKCAGVTRAMTLNNLQTGFPNIFQAITGFSSVCAQVFESVYSQSECSNRIHDPKRLLT